MKIRERAFDADVAGDGSRGVLVISRLANLDGNGQKSHSFVSELLQEEREIKERVKLGSGNSLNLFINIL